METQIQKRCIRLSKSLNKIRDFDKGIYTDVLFLIAASLETDASTWGRRASPRGYDRREGDYREKTVSF
jgi:hypothetical protein